MAKLDTSTVWRDYITGKTQLSSLNKKDKEDLLKYGLNIGAINPSTLNSSIIREYNLSDTIKPLKINTNAYTSDLSFSEPSKPSLLSTLGTKGKSFIDGLSSYKPADNPMYSDHSLQALNDTKKVKDTSFKANDFTMPSATKPEINIPSFTPTNTNFSTGLKTNPIDYKVNLTDALKKHLPSDGVGNAYDDAKALRQEHLSIKNQDKPQFNVTNKAEVGPSYDIKGKPVIPAISNNFMPSKEQMSAMSKPIETTKPQELDIASQNSNWGNLSYNKVSDDYKVASKPITTTVKPAEKDGFFESIKEGWTEGTYSAKMGLEAYKAMQGKENQLDKLVEEYEKRTDLIPKDGNGWFQKALRGASSQLPLWLEAAKTGIKTGVLAGTSAFAAGQAGPQVLTPEEIITVPAAFAAGFTAGNAVGFGKIMAGLDYKEFVDAGIDENLSTMVALGTGTINSILETAQFGKILNSFPGGQKLKSLMIRNAAKNAAEEAIDKFGYRIMKEGIKNLTQETAEEVMQEIVTIYGRNLATEMHNDKYGDRIEKISAREGAKRVAETAIDSLLTFGVLLTPGVTLNLASQGVINMEEKKNINSVNSTLDVLLSLANTMPEVAFNSVDVAERYGIMRTLFTNSSNNMANQEAKAEIAQKFMIFEEARKEYLLSVDEAQAKTIIAQDKQSEIEAAELLKEKQKEINAQGDINTVDEFSNDSNVNTLPQDETLSQSQGIAPSDDIVAPTNIDIANEDVKGAEIPLADESAENPQVIQGTEIQGAEDLTKAGNTNVEVAPQEIPGNVAEIPQEVEAQTAENPQEIINEMPDNLETTNLEETAQNPQEVEETASNPQLSKFGYRIQNKLDKINKDRGFNFKIATYDNTLDTLSRFEQDKILEAVTGDATDVKIKGGYIEIAYVDDEVDFMYLSNSEYESRYGEQYDDLIREIESPPTIISQMDKLGTFTSKDFAYTKIDFYEYEDDIILKFSGYKQKPMWMEIREYKNLTANEIINYTVEYDMPLGNHFEDGLRSIWKEKGLDQGSFTKITKPIDAPRDETAGKPQEVEETAQNPQEESNEMPDNLEDTKVDETAQNPQEVETTVNPDEANAENEAEIPKDETAQKPQEVDETASNPQNETVDKVETAETTNVDETATKPQEEEKTAEIPQEVKSKELNLADYGLSMFYAETKNGKPAWNVIGNTYNLRKILSKAGAEFFGPFKSWSFYQEESPEAKILELLKQETTFSKLEFEGERLISPENLPKSVIEMLPEKYSSGYSVLEVLEHFLGFFMDEAYYIDPLVENLKNSDNVGKTASKVLEDFKDFMRAVKFEGISVTKDELEQFKTGLENVLDAKIIELYDKIKDVAYKTRKGKYNIGDARKSFTEFADKWYSKLKKVGEEDAKGNQGDASVDKGQQPTDVQEITKRGDNAGVSGEEERGTDRHGGSVQDTPKDATGEGSDKGQDELQGATRPDDIRRTDVSDGNVQGVNQTASERRGLGLKNYQYTEETLKYLDKRKESQIIEDNLAAIRLIKELNGALANSEQQEVLARYNGWGNLNKVFYDSEFSEVASELENLLSTEEFRRIRSSTLSAFFTTQPIIKGMYDMLKNLGFYNGRILEPSSGIGSFIGNMPRTMMNNSSINMVELDPITGTIASNLYPNSNVFIQAFEDAKYPDNYFDVAIGNVPFVNNNLKYDKTHLKVHDYFIVKSLDLVRPGGIVAFLTTNGTMDKKSKTARLLMYEKADLIAGYRIPPVAFDTADVVTDLLIFRKRGPSDERLSDEWLETQEKIIDSRKLDINSYFLNHADNVLGELSSGTNLYGAVVKVKSDLSKADIGELLSEKAKELPSIYKEYVGLIKEISQEELELRNGSIVIKDGKAFEKKGNKLEELNKTAKEIKIIQEIKALAADTNAILDMQANAISDEEVFKALKKLEAKYDSFVKRYGNVSSKEVRLAMSDDLDFQRVTLMEKPQNREVKKGNKTRNEVYYIKNKDFFTKRFAGVAKPKLTADTVVEAINTSIGMYNKIDIPYMAELMKQEESYITKAIEPYVFNDPIAGLVTKEEYLSGNILNKLEMAKFFAKEDKAFEKNVKALEKVKPKTKPFEEIELYLGSNIIPDNIVNQFFYDVFDVNYDVEYVSTLNTWLIKNRAYSRKTAQYEPKGNRNFVDFLTSILNNKTIVIKEKLDTGQTVVNREATIDANMKADLLKKDFLKWLSSSENEAFRQMIEEDFNNRFNAVIPRTYNVETIILPGFNPQIILRASQKVAIARVVQNGNTLMALDVGVGKTYSMIAAAMELRRLGRARKPVFVVPKKKIVDFQNDFLYCYPQANILVLTEEINKSPKKRAEFYAQVAGLSEIDAVIISRENINQIPISKEREIKYIQQKLDDLYRVKSQFADDNTRGSGRFQNDLNKSIESLETSLKEILAMPKDNTFTFEQIGFDAILVDEAHNFKNLKISSRYAADTRGVAISNAKRADGLAMKVDYVNEITNYKNVIFATATPLSNSLSEMYNMMRYLIPHKLKEYGVLAFDEWVSTFGRLDDVIKLTYDQEGFSLKRTFIGIVNAQEIVKLFKEVAYFVKAKDEKDIELPETENVHVKIDSSEQLREYIQYIGREAANPSADTNPLELYTSGKYASVDMRFVANKYYDVFGKDLNEAAIKGSKIYMSADKIAQEYKASEKTKGTQLVFADFGVDGGNSKVYDFPLYEELKKVLIEKGVKESDIAFVKEYEGKDDLLYEKMNTGEIRVLIGSTAKMGEGLNVQKKVVAMHHLTIPMKPSDIQQRNGRGIRHGNENKKVKIFYYINKGSFDAISWDLINEKAKKIDEAIYGDALEKSIDDDIQVTGAMLQAAALENPKLAERIQVAKKVSDLELEESIFIRSLNDAKSSIKFAERKIEELEREKGFDEKSQEDFSALRAKLKDPLTKIKPDEEKKAETKKGKGKEAPKEEAPKKNPLKIKVDGKAYDNIYDMFTAIHAYEKKSFGEYTKVIGELEGAKLHLNVGFDTLNYRFKQFGISINGGPAVYMDLTDSQSGMLTKLVNRLDFTKDIQIKEKKIDGHHKEIESFNEYIKRGFDKKEELEALKTRLMDLDIELGLVVDLTESTNTEIDIEEDAPSDGDISSKPKYSYAEAFPIYEAQSPKVVARVKNKMANDKAKISSSFDIIRLTRDLFNIPISHQRFSSRKASGYFTPSNNTIKVKDYDNFGVLSHELGHFFSQRYNLTLKLREDKLKEYVNKVHPGFLELYAEKDRVEEAVAEFIREYFVNYDELFKALKKDVIKFEQTLSNEDFKKLQMVAEEVRKYISADRIEQAKLSMHSYVEKDKINSHDKNMMKIMAKMYVADDLAKIKEFSEAAGIKMNTRDADINPYILALHSRTSDAIVEHILKRSLIDKKGTDIGPSLLELYEKIGVDEYSDFNLYLKLKHALTTEKMIFSESQYKQGPIGKMDMDEDIKELEKKYPHFEKTQKDINIWWKAFMKLWLLDTGLITPDLFTELMQMYPNYVPTYRKIEPNNLAWKFLNKLKANSGNKSSFSDQEFSKRLKGSSMDSYMPMENLIIAASNIVKAAKKNEVMQAMVSAYNHAGKDKNNHIGDYFQIVKPALMKKQFNMEMIKYRTIRGILKDAGVTAEELKEAYSINELLKIAIDKKISSPFIVDATIEDIITQFTPQKHEKGIFALAKVNGEDIHLQFHDPLLLESVKHLEYREAGELLKLIGSVKRTMTILITGANPIFGLTSNVWSDVQQAYIYGSEPNMIKHIANVASSMKSVFSKDEKALAYRAMGGQFMASKVSTGDRTMDKILNQAIPGRKKEHPLKSAVNSFIDSIEGLNEMLESSPRMAEFYKYYNKDDYAANLYAWYMSQEVTTNFLRKGIINNSLGQVIPFFNAGIQGLNKLVRAASSKEEAHLKKERLIKALTYMTVLAIVQEALLGDDDDYKEIKDGIKDSYWLIRSGDTFIRIRKPRELGFLFASVPQRIIRQLKGDEEAWNDLADSIKTIFAPPLRTVFSPVIDAMANTSWSGYPIVGQGLSNKMPEEQYDEKTSELGKIVGKIFNISPKKVDYVLQQYSGGIGQIVLPALTKTKGLSGAVEGIKMKMIIDPLYSNKTTDTFYDNIEKLTQASEYYKDNSKKTKYYNEGLRKYMNRISRDLSDARTLIKKIESNKTIPKDKKEELIKKQRQFMLDRAKSANETFNKIMREGQ